MRSKSSRQAKLPPAGAGWAAAAPAPFRAPAAPRPGWWASRPSTRPAAGTSRGRCCRGRPSTDACPGTAPTRPVGRLDEIGVAGRGDGIAARGVERPLRQDRVPLPRHVGSAHRAAAEHDLRVLVAGAALGADEHVPAILLEYVRRLDPDGLRGQVDAAVHQQQAVAEHPALREVDLAQVDRAVAVVLRLAAGRRPVVHDVGAPVVVEEQRRVDAVDLAQPDRIGPGPRGIAGGHVEVAAALSAHARGDHVEGPAVAADRRREDPLGHLAAVQVELRGPRQHVPDRAPAHQVAALEDRHAREVREARRHEVVVVADAADARIRMEAGQHRVAVRAGRQRRLERGIAADVLEPLEEGRRVGRGGPPRRRTAGASAGSPAAWTG